MRRKSNKLISILLVFCMVLSLLPINVFASDSQAIYVVAGVSELCGTVWDPSPETSADNVMTANGDGTFSKVYIDVAHMDNYQLKVVENTSGGSQNWYGIDGGDYNVTFNVEEECNVTVTFDLATRTITVTGDGVEIPTGIDIESMRVAGNGDGNWLNGVPWDPSADENLMTEVSPDVYEITYTDIDEFDNYQFKFAANGSWSENWGGVYAGSGVETDAVFNSSDSITFEVPYELADVTLRLDLTNFDYETKLGAKFTVTVTGKTEPVSSVPATAESETTLPATTVALTGLNVTATSNYFPEKSVFIQAGEEYVTVTYYIDSAKDMLNCQWQLKYDPEILKFENAVNMKADGNTQNLMPLVEKKSEQCQELVWNVLKNESGEQTGVIKANATSLELYDFADKGIVPFVTVTFRVIGSGETTVDLFMDVLTLSKLGSNLMTDPAEEESVVNYGVINDTPTKPVRNTSVYAGLFGSEELCEHNNTFEYPEVPESCTEDGYTAGVFCEDCQNWISGHKLIKRHHNYGEWETVKEPTCTEDGLKVRNCSVCGTGTVNLPTESLPKCTGSDYKYNMDKTFSTFTVPDASQIIIHFSSDSYLESNFDYLYIYEGDTVDSDHLVNKYSGSLSLLAVTVNASSFTLRMVTDGSVTKYGFEIESLEFSSCEMGIIPALGHDYSEEWTIDREPTCTTEGIKSHHCTRCDSQEDITEVSMLPHTYTLTVVPPTCTEDGYTEHTCSVCGYSFNDTVVPELGHNIEEYVQIKAPTCTDTGTAKGKCTRCSYSETRTIDALGHSYSDEWTVDREPTCTTDGSKSHHCTRCDNKDSITVIQALGHDYETQVVDANCTEKGYTIYTCSRCGDTYRDDYVDAAGHKYGEWQTRNEPTCTEKGVKYRACSVCSNEETGEIPAKGHSYGDWIVDKEATVLAEGSRHRVCTDCNHSETQTIDRVTIDINTNTDYGLANFTVVNAQTLEPIKNACIFISTEKDGENTFSTDSSGKVSVILPVGKQAVSVYAEGCLTRNTNVTVKSGVNDIPKIGLSDKSTYTAEVTHHLMSMDEIKDAGIDTSAVDNQHIFKYELKLEFQPEIDWLSLFYYMGDSGEILGGGGTGVVPDSSSSSTTQALNGIVWIPASTDSKSDGGHFYIPPTKSEPATCVYPVSEHFYLIVRGEVRWLKEMFDVEMLIVNNSQTDTLENLTATLNIPEGLSLATMVGEQQTAAQQIEKIAEGESKSVHWYLRGDTAGDYNITARLQGMIMPFEEPIDDVFESREALHVWAGNALSLHFEFPDSAYYGENYPITITLENVSDVTLYNLSHAVQIEQGMEIFYSDGTSKQKIERSKWETVGVDEFRPGDKIIIQTSVNIFFESEVIERKLEQWVGFVDDIEQLMNAFKMLKTAYDATESLINCVSGCSKALDSFILSSGGSSDKLELFKQLHSKISGLALSYSTSGNKTLDAAVKLANSGVSTSLNAITNDPDEWLKNHSVNDIKKLIKNVESLENSITDNAGSSSRFDIYDSIRTAISAIPTKFALKSVTMTEDENNTTSIPWSYSVSSAGAHYFGVSNVSKYLASIAQAAMSEIYDEAMPDYIQLIPGLDDPFNKDDAVSYIKATENEIAKFKAKAATGDVTFRAWVESSKTMKSILPVGTLLQALPNELANSGFVISCDNETAQYQDGVLTFTGDGTISVIPENSYGGTLYIQDSEGHLYTYVLDVVPEHVCHKGDTEIVIPPTEEYDGFAVKRCETCYDVLEIIPLSNEQLCSEHTFGEWNVEKEASCAETGFRERNCSVCGHTEYEVIDSVPHTYGEWQVTKEATCAEEGEETAVCEKCGDVISRTTEKPAHTEGEWQIVKEATEAEEGAKQLTCSVCGKVLDTKTIPKIETNIMIGDINSDGSVDAVDAQLIMNYLNANESLSNYQKLTADVNGDRTLDKDDATLLSQHINGETVESHIGELINLSALAGDVNRDGHTNISDATYIQFTIAGFVELTELDSIISDLNGDGKVNIEDVTELQKYLAKFVNSVSVSQTQILPYSIRLDERNLTLGVGEKKKLNLNILPLDLVNFEITFTSDNESVAVVDSDGLIKAVGIGTANVTIQTENGLQESCCVTVNENSEYTFIYNDDDTLTITGYTGGDTSLLIPSTIYNKKVTAIADNAFKNNTKITEVTVSDGIESIGECAFGYCSNLQTITLPDSVTEIGKYLLRNCVKLTKVRLSQGLTVLPHMTFFFCRLLSEVDLPSGLNEIGSSAFQMCNSLEHVTLPFGLTTIGSSAFTSCSNLKSISIPDSVTVIKNNAFGYCTSLTSVTLPPDITTISDHLFNNSGIVSINIPDGVKKIESSAFLSCSKLTNVVIPDSVTTMQWNCFQYCSELKSIDLSNVEYVDNSAFMYSGIESLYIPAQLIMSDGAFSGCANLKSVSVAPDNPRYCAEDGIMFSKDKSTLLLYPAGREENYYQIPDCVERIGYGAFSCAGLISMKLPDSVLFIDEKAFELCHNLISFEFTQNIRRIPFEMFAGCENLQYVLGTEQVDEVGFRAFAECYSLKTAVFPYASTIGDMAFQDCRSLSSIVLNDSAYIKLSAFAGCSSLRHVFKFTINDVDYGNPEDGWNVESDNDALLNAVLCTGSRDDYSVIYNAPTCDDNGSLEFRCNLCGYSDLYVISSFSHEYQAISVQPPTCMDEGYTVYRCVHCGDEYRSDFTQVTDHNFVDGKCEYCELTDPSFEISGTTGDCVWTLNKSSKTLTISGGTRMEDYQYNQHAPWESYGSDLEHIVIENGITKLGDYAFYNCSGVNEINIPDSVKEIGKYSLYNTGITELVIPDSVTDIANWALQKCQNLTSVSIGKKVECIGYAAFANCSALTSISIPDSVTQLDDYVFSRCISLKSVTLPATIKKIPSGFFYECTDLESVYIPESVTCISSYSFKNCDSLTKLEIPQGANAINECAFRDCDNLKEFVIPETIEDIRDYSIGYYYDNGYKKYTDIVIKGYTNSVAETYANDNGFAFVSIGVRTEQ